jgi:hypothetical protein
MPELRGVSRLKRQQTQVKSPLTAEFVKAGRKLIEEALQHDPESPKSHPFLGFLSQKRVVAQANDGRRGKKATAPALRDRWEPHSNYVRDLVDHIRQERVKESFPVLAAEDIEEALASDVTPSQLVRGIAQLLLVNVFDNEYFRLRMVTLAALGAPKYRDSAEEESAVAFYREIDALWEPLFERYFEKYGLKLRVGVEMNDLVQMATAFGEGLALRELADPTSPDAPERKERIKLHSDGLLAFVLAFAEPRDAASVSIDKAVDGMAEGDRSG